MIRLRHKLFIHGLRIGDQAILALSLFITVSLAKGVTSLEHIYIVFQREYKLFESVGLISMIVIWSIIFDRFIRYDTNRFTTLGSQIYRLAKACTTTSFLLLLVAALFEFETLVLQSIAIFWALSLGLGTLLRIAILLLLLLFRRNKANLRQILVVGANQEAVDMAKRIDENKELGCAIAGYVSEDPAQTGSDIPGGPALGVIDDLQTILEKGSVDEILICLPFQEFVKDIVRIVNLGHDLGIVVRYIPRQRHNLILRNLQIENLDGQHILTLFRQQMVGQLLLKRVMDIFVSSIALILLSPLLAAVAVAIKTTGKGPVLFTQQRVGMNRRSFTLYKFRSMVANAEELKEKLAEQNEVDGPVFKIKRDPRVTTVGRFIRKTSIDELPQLWNVLKGDMTLVGPRPPLPSEVDQYDWLFRRRLSIKPGITCLWQVSGRNEVSFKEWMDLDKRYIETWTIWLDIKILLKTIPVVLLGKGAS